MYRIPIFARGEGETGGGSAGDDGKGSGDDGKGSKAADDITARLAAAEARAASLEKAESDRLAKAKQAAEAEAVKRGEHEAVLKTREAELADAKARLDSLEKAEGARIAKLTAANAAKIKALPEQYRGLIPDGLSPDAVAEHVDKLAALAGGDDGVSRGTRRGTGGDESIPAASTAEWERFGRHLGVSEKDWFTNTWKPRQKATGATH